MNTHTRKLFVFLLAVPLGPVGCKTAFSPQITDGAVSLPFLKNSPNECYFLDEFMPMPDGMVSGKNGSLDLRYYTYKTANYKEWRLEEIMLAFYSNNGRCWSLFEEYYVVD